MLPPLLLIWALTLHCVWGMMPFGHGAEEFDPPEDRVPATSPSHAREKRGLDACPQGPRLNFTCVGRSWGCPCCCCCYECKRICEGRGEL
nr:protein E6B [Equid gammaherpesvirus 5]UTK45607.1 protein E6B [Equid gammaherpesvirus 5]UTK45686.1 protein E6B [Equid gammaherpesvirus 5]UTK45765.1 protein E6B [Equid gammaherpesvirus 5]